MAKASSGVASSVRLDLLMQHELQGRAGDLVIVDHDHPSLVDFFRLSDTDLQCCSPENPLRQTGLQEH
ncbi:hypothetical protein CQ14_39975 [Bradyrhizobium lablabi]|uniref:Uncharacterized protein n=1 Tax=Bradyrhizobium lablabi TaxID=722472 RepID=A0A0R3MB80_9BRAD|nr:hypothetical protein CQ14_39975 [Bradyrhizobium lablabi]